MDASNLQGFFWSLQSSLLIAYLQPGYLDWIICWTAFLVCRLLGRAVLGKAVLVQPRQAPIPYLFHTPAAAVYSCLLS
ncbi:hypothetical protein XELAEV_18046603mg [Xenopus laevis]|uniref:Uncharacterized protein n=1 Tax=Xenopus laevis TaxID=8355 RepID=A0A974BTI3_XENLA|nr:hypothetical protein XELAEV_18046603mg [Xenopus laevis]